MKVRVGSRLFVPLAHSHIRVCGTLPDVSTMKVPLAAGVSSK